MCWRFNSEGVGEFQPRVFTVGTKKKALANAESVGEHPFEILANAFSVCSLS